jgi:hypothetical protein
MTCKYCSTLKKDWTGGDPKCAFRAGRFCADNWMCATMTALRTLFDDCDPLNESTVPIIVDEQRYVMLPVADIFYRDNEPNYDVLCVGWYKDRGRTETLVLLGDAVICPNPSEKDLERILNFYAVNHEPLAEFLRENCSIVTPKPSPDAT